MSVNNQCIAHTPNQVETNEDLLKQFEYYIVYHARSLVHRYSRSANFERGDEADELIQRTRIKFWQTLCKSHIEYPRAYIKRIIFTEFSDMKRQQKTYSPLSLNEDEVEDQFEQLENAPDPADEVEQHLEGEEFLQKVIQLILRLPPRQRSAIICLLLDQVDDPTHLADLLKKYQLNIEGYQRPSGKAEKKLLRASLYIARQTLAKNLHVDIHTGKRYGTW